MPITKERALEVLKGNGKTLIPEIAAEFGFVFTYNPDEIRADGQPKAFATLADARKDEFLNGLADTLQSVENPAEEWVEQELNNFITPRLQAQELAALKIENAYKGLRVRRQYLAQKEAEKKELNQYANQLISPDDESNDYVLTSQGEETDLGIRVIMLEKLGFGADIPAGTDDHKYPLLLAEAKAFLKTNQAGHVGLRAVANIDATLNGFSNDKIILYACNVREGLLANDKIRARFLGSLERKTQELNKAGFGQNVLVDGQTRKNLQERYNAAIADARAFLNLATNRELLEKDLFNDAGLPKANVRQALRPGVDVMNSPDAAHPNRLHNHEVHKYVMRIKELERAANIIRARQKGNVAREKIEEQYQYFARLRTLFPTDLTHLTNVGKAINWLVKNDNKRKTFFNDIKHQVDEAKYNADPGAYIAIVLAGNISEAAIKIQAAYRKHKDKDVVNIKKLMADRKAVIAAMKAEDALPANQGKWPRRITEIEHDADLVRDNPRMPLQKKSVFALEFPGSSNRTDKKNVSQEENGFAVSIYEGHNASERFHRDMIGAAKSLNKPGNVLEGDEFKIAFAEVADATRKFVEITDANGVKQLKPVDNPSKMACVVVATAGGVSGSFVADQVLDRLKSDAQTRFEANKDELYTRAYRLCHDMPYGTPEEKAAKHDAVRKMARAYAREDSLELMSEEVRKARIYSQGVSKVTDDERLAIVGSFHAQSAVKGTEKLLNDDLQKFKDATFSLSKIAPPVILGSGFSYQIDPKVPNAIRVTYFDDGKTHFPHDIFYAYIPGTDHCNVGINVATQEGQILYYHNKNGMRVPVLDEYGQPKKCPAGTIAIDECISREMKDGSRKPIPVYSKGQAFGMTYSGALKKEFPHDYVAIETAFQKFKIQANSEVNGQRGVAIKSDLKMSAARGTVNYSGTLAPVLVQNNEGEVIKFTKKLAKLKADGTVEKAGGWQEQEMIRLPAYLADLYQDRSADAASAQKRSDLLGRLAVRVSYVPKTGYYQVGDTIQGFEQGCSLDQEIYLRDPVDATKYTVVPRNELANMFGPEILTRLSQIQVRAQVGDEFKDKTKELQAAVMNQDLDKVTEILALHARLKAAGEEGLDIDAVNERTGETLLHQAVKIADQMSVARPANPANKQKAQDIANALIAAGADILARNKDQKIASDFAERDATFATDLRAKEKEVRIGKPAAVPPAAPAPAVPGKVDETKRALVDKMAQLNQAVDVLRTVSTDINTPRAEQNTAKDVQRVAIKAGKKMRNENEKLRKREDELLQTPDDKKAAQDLDRRMQKVADRTAKAEQKLVRKAAGDEGYDSPGTRRRNKPSSIIIPTGARPATAAEALALVGAAPAGGGRGGGGRIT